jgi:hypothetical protein
LTIEENVQIVDPDISISSNNIEFDLSSGQTSFKVPDVTNNSGVEYAWYIGNTQLIVDANGYFNYNATGDFVIYLETVGTERYNSIKIYCNYTNIEYKNQYFTIESLENNNTIKITPSYWSHVDCNEFVLGYSRDLKTWSYDVVEYGRFYPPVPAESIMLSFKLNKNEKLYLKVITVYKIRPLTTLLHIKATKNHNVSGNIMSLVYGEDFKGKTTTKYYDTYNCQGAQIFSGMFANNTTLISAEHLVLPIQALQDEIYASMFEGCTSLIKAPELPATTMCTRAYFKMFKDCTSLVSAPELPATKMALACYSNMFVGCTSLINAPELPAIDFLDYYSCYNTMFKDCTSLVSAPELPATILTRWVYTNMFNGCTSLSYVKILATDISASGTIVSSNGCLTGWLSNVSPTGTFIKKSDTQFPTGPSGIPQGWTVVNI